MIPVVDISRLSGTRLTQIARQIGISRSRRMTDEDLRNTIWARRASRGVN